METRLLLAIHRLAGPRLDFVFLVSHAMGSRAVLSTLVLGAALVHALRGERREAAAWIAVGLAVATAILGLKDVVARPRPELWPRVATQGGSSFPSGHAIATAAFYPLLAWLATRRRPGWRPVALALAVGGALFVGLGRLYLGLHWPTDVLAGWLLGAALSAGAITWLSRTA